MTSGTRTVEPIRSSSNRLAVLTLPSAATTVCFGGYFYLRVAVYRLLYHTDPHFPLSSFPYHTHLFPFIRLVALKRLKSIMAGLGAEVSSLLQWALASKHPCLRAQRQPFSDAQHKKPHQFKTFHRALGGHAPVSFYSFQAQDAKKASQLCSTRHSAPGRYTGYLEGMVRKQEDLKTFGDSRFRIPFNPTRNKSAVRL
ncbi:hypothetical protein RRG08_054033 [Elysia crispata]|uniref:Uncharacterized protein n=1 Tax=Elysia crispata TaxID=231223 RepID=A0AAE1DDL8_9GAST|nr:hypothetical protein RRG08_054033 [Elysia crispata]